MTQIIAKDLIQSWSPRPLNRGEFFELDHTEIFFTNKEARVNLFLEVKNKQIIKRTFVGDPDHVYSEVLKALPDFKVEAFKEAWINTKLDTFFEHAFDKNLKDKIKITKRNEKADVVVGNKKIEIKVDKSKKEIIDLGYFNYQNPNQILADKIRASELDISEIAEKVGLHVSMVSKQMKGQRDITRDHAFKYAKFFGCDPADILFAAPQVPIWSTVNFLDFTNDEMPFNPGECIAEIKERELVVCPRDIYRPDIKAVKVKSPGSYLDGMVLFYYATSDVKQDCLGRLSIVGDEDDLDDDLMKELRHGEKQRYYIGILEQYKGKLNLLNPDPYANENKINDGVVIKNIIPSFASPIVGIVNPNQIKKDKHSSKLFKVNDEMYKMQRQAEEVAVRQAKVLEMQKRKLEEQSAKLKKQLEIQVQKAAKELDHLQKKIEEEKKNKLFSGIGTMFYGQERKAGLLDFEDLKKKRANKK